MPSVVSLPPHAKTIGPDDVLVSLGERHEHEQQSYRGRFSSRTLEGCRVVVATEIFDRISGDVALF